MKRTTIVVASTVLALGIAGGASAVGKHRFGNPEKRAAFMVEYVSDELNLDATQEQALSALKDQVLAARGNLREQMKSTHEQARELMSADQFDRAQALALVSGKTAAINAAAPEIVTALGDFLDTLDAEQKAAVAEFITERRGHRHGRRHSR